MAATHYKKIGTEGN